MGNLRTKKKSTTKSSTAPKRTGKKAEEHPHIIEPIRHLAIPIESIHPDPSNARAHPDRNLQAVKASLAKFGQRAPLVVQKQGMIVRAGNARLTAAQELGWTHIAAAVVDENDVQATAFAIADNRTAELAEWDYPVLGEVLSALQAAEDIELVELGWEQTEIDALIVSPTGEDSMDFSGDTNPQLDGLSYKIVVDCAGEEHQRIVLAVLEKEGIECRVLTS